MSFGLIAINVFFLFHYESSYRGPDTQSANIAPKCFFCKCTVTRLHECMHVTWSSTFPKLIFQKSKLVKCNAWIDILCSSIHIIKCQSFQCYPKCYNNILTRIAFWKASNGSFSIIMTYWVWSTCRWNAIFQHFATIQDILMNSFG